MKKSKQISEKLSSYPIGKVLKQKQLSAKCTKVFKETTLLRWNT